MSQEIATVDMRVDNLSQLSGALNDTLSANVSRIWSAIDDVIAEDIVPLQQAVAVNLNEITKLNQTMIELVASVNQTLNDIIEEYGPTITALVTAVDDVVEKINSFTACVGNACLVQPVTCTLEGLGAIQDGFVQSLQAGNFHPVGYTVGFHCNDGFFQAGAVTTSTCKYLKVYRRITEDVDISTQVCQCWNNNDEPPPPP